MVDEVDEKPLRTKQERRQRQKRLEQTWRRRQTEKAPATIAPAGTEAGTELGEPPANDATGLNAARSRPPTCRA